MSRHENLFSNKLRLFANSNRITTNNRKIQHQQRAQQRKQLHQNARRNVSPMPMENEKENQVATTNTTNATITTSTTTTTTKRAEVTGHNGPSKQELQQSYLKRFVEWKEQKRQQREALRPAAVKVADAKAKGFPFKSLPTAKPKNAKIEKPTTTTTKVDNQAAKAHGRRSIYELVGPAKTEDVVVQPRKLDFSTISLLNKQFPTVSSTSTTTTITTTTTTTTGTKKLSNLLGATGFEGKVVSNVVGRGAAGKARQMFSKNRQPTNAKLAVPLKAKKPVQSNAVAANVKRFTNQDMAKVTTKSAAFKPKTNVPKQVPVKSKIPDNIGTKKVVGVKPKPKPAPHKLRPTNAPTREQPGTNNAIHTPSSGKFDPSVTSTQERNSAHFDFEGACAITNNLTTNNNCMDIMMMPIGNKSTPATGKKKSEHGLTQRKLSRQYAIDVEFVRNESTLANDSQADDVTLKAYQTLDKGKPPLDDEQVQTLEAVNGFRQQLASETARLLELCHEWEAYRDANQLEHTCANEMIDVTIGQTKLLTSKKFQQFKGLIDRCEARVTGINDIVNDGSEGTKPITQVDLEGFWSMVGLQVQNVEKRFADLEKWKSNNWTDPYLVKPKAHKKTSTASTTTMAKPKASGSSALRGMIRKKQEEMRRIQEMNGDTNNGDVLVLTPNKRKEQQIQQQQNKSSPRRTILVRDRKQFSNLPTILVMSPKSIDRHRSPSVEKSAKKLSEVKLEQGASTCTSLLRSALRAATAQRRSATPLPAQAPDTPLRAKNTPSRKSILKTPGTERSAMKRQVSFNLSAMMKNIKFVDDSSDGESDEE